MIEVIAGDRPLDELAANILGTWHAAQIKKRHLELCERRPRPGLVAWECWEIVQTHPLGINSEAAAKIDLSGYPGY